MNRHRRRSARILALLAAGTLGTLPAFSGIAAAAPTGVIRAGTSVADRPADCPGDWLGTTRNAAPTISANGRFVTFEGYPDDENDARDILLRDVRRGTTTAITHVSNSESAYTPVISDDGNRVAYLLAATGGERLRVYDRRTGTSTDQGLAEVGVSPDISADGRFVVFAAEDQDDVLQVYVRDVDAQRTTLVSASPTGGSGNGSASNPTISADGRHILFFSNASNLTTDGSGANGAIYLRDLRTRTTTVIPDASGNSSRPAGFWQRLSPDGRYVLYLNGGLWMYDRVRGITVAASTPQSESYSISPISDVSAGGRSVTFAASYYVGEEPDGDAFSPVIVRDVRSGAETVTSVGTDGSLEPWAGSYLGAITPNGRYVTFYSTAVNLDPRDLDSTLDVFVRDLRTGVTTLVSDTDAGPRCEPSSRVN